MVRMVMIVLSGWLLVSVFASVVLGRVMAFGAAVDAPEVDARKVERRLAS